MKRIRFTITIEMDDKNPPWDNAYDYRKSYRDFLAAHGVQGEPIEYMNGSSNDVVFYLTPIEIIELPKKPQTPPSKVFENLRNQPFKKK